MAEYVIGIDIGATKSHLAVFDTTGSLVEFSHWGPLNHETLPGSFTQLKNELEQFVVQCLQKNSISIEEVSYSAHGIAGVDTKKQHGIISEILQKIGFKNFTLVNDAFLGVFAGNPAGRGICALNGTGCTLAGINNEGRMLKIGGAGYISADYGGSGMMGQKVISAVYSELFRKGRHTGMTPLLLQKLGIADKHDFIDKVYEKIEDGSLNVAACNKMLFEAIWDNDKAAAEIVHDIAVNYASGISCMIEEIQFCPEEEINIVFAGSVFVKSEHPLLLDTIKEKVNIYNPGYRFNYTLLDVPPVAGAVIWALNEYNKAGAYYDKVRSQFRNT